MERIPEELVEQIMYEKILSLFYEKDLDMRDVAEHVAECSCDSERSGVLLRWIDHQSYDDEWKSEVDPALLELHLD